MSKLFGHLTLNDTDYVFQATAGQRAIYEAVAEYVARGNTELNSQMSTLVAETTTDHTRRFYLPGSGYLQEIGPDGRPSAVKAAGSWDVSFPLVIKGDQSVGNRTAMAHMTAGALAKHVDTVIADNFNSVRRDILERLFNDGAGAAITMTDDEWGNLSVQPLANGDATLYPPVIGSMTEAVEDHYLAAGYLTAAIADGATDPFVVLVPELTDHFGYGANCITWMNRASATVVRALTNFNPVTDPRLTNAVTAQVPISVPAGVPGTVIGYHSAGTWVAIWDYIPADYMLSICLDVEAPLVKRVDRAGLSPDLTMVIEDDEYPFRASFWEHRYGFGCGNRLNGAVMYFTAGAYAVPTIV